MTVPRFAGGLLPPSPLRLGAIVAVAAAVVSAFAFPPGTERTPDPPPGTITAPEPDAAAKPFPQKTAAPPEGDLIIVESGYTPMVDLVGDHMVSWGVVVENTATTLHAGGWILMTATVDGKKETLDVPVNLLAPGTRTAVGDTTYVDADHKVTDLDVEVKAAAWFDTFGASFAVTTTDVEGIWTGAGEHDNYWSSDGISFPTDERGDLTIGFRAESTSTTFLPRPSYTAIFRDREGRIVGAYTDNLVGHAIPPGWSIRTFRIGSDPPESLAEDGIEVYVTAG